MLGPPSDLPLISLASGEPKWHGGGGVRLRLLIILQTPPKQEGHPGSKPDRLPWGVGCHLSGGGLFLMPPPRLMSSSTPLCPRSQLAVQVPAVPNTPHPFLPQDLCPCSSLCPNHCSAGDPRAHSSSCCSSWLQCHLWPSVHSRETVSRSFT